MWYRDMMPHDKTNLAQKLTKCSDVLFVVTNERKRDLPTSECGLPMALTIGENKFMILRKCPVVIDYKKFDKQTEQHIWQYSRLIIGKMNINSWATRDIQLQFVILFTIT